MLYCVLCLGTTRQVILRSMQGVRIKEIQDEYLGCLRQQGILQAQISVTVSFIVQIVAVIDIKIT